MFFGAKKVRKFLALVLSVIVLVEMAEARLLFSSEDPNFDDGGKFVIDTTDDFNQIDLKFGEALGARIQYDKIADKFLFNRDSDFEDNELKNIRLENLSAAPTCDNSVVGKVYYNTTNDVTYSCDGTSWNALGGGTSGSDTNLKPYIGGIVPRTIEPGQTSEITISGGNFEPGIVFDLGPEVTINTTTIISDQIATLNVTTSGNNQAPFTITALNGLSTSFGSTTIAVYAFGSSNRPASSCYEIKKEITSSSDGNYWIQTESMSTPVEVYCDMTYDGGGWLLIGRGREEWDWDNAGKGTVSEVIQNVGTTSAFVPKYYSSTFIDELLDGSYVNSLQDGVRIKRAWDTTASAYQENIWRFQSLLGWDWNFDVSKNLTHLQKDPGDTTYTNFGARNSRDSQINNDNDRIFTWAWTGHANKRGFSYGSAVTTGTNSATNFLWESVTENHSIPYSEVYIRPKFFVSGNSSDSAGFSPYITTVNKFTLAVNTTQTIVISGKNFVPGTSVSIPGFDGSINSITVNSPNELEINITPGSTETIYDVVLSNAGYSNTVWAGNGKDLIETKNLTILTPGNGTTNWVRSASATTSIGELVPNSTASGWSKGASFGTVPASTDFTLSFQPKYMTGQSAGGYAMIGIDQTDPNQNYNTMDYAIYLQNGTNLYVYENGTSRGAFGSWTVTDTFEVQRNGSVITYLKNGVVFYTSAVSSTSSVVFDSSLYRYLGATNVSISY